MCTASEWSTSLVRRLRIAYYDAMRYAFVLFAAALALMPSNSIAGVCDEPGVILCDDFNDGAIDPFIWSVVESGSGASIAEVNGRLEIELAPDATNGPAGEFRAQYVSNCDLRGDFDVEVEYKLLHWPPNNGARLNLRNAIPDFGQNDAAAIVRVSFGPPSDFPGAPNESYLLATSGPTFAIAGTTDMQGRLRVTRTGAGYSGFYFVGSDWVEVSTGSFITDDVHLSLSLHSNDGLFAGQPVRIAFDNVVVRHGELACVCPVEFIEAFEACDAALVDCLTDPPILDADGDGEPDVSDVCPLTDPGSLVDASGCSHVQFCRGLVATTRDGRRTCRRSDWRNDEATTNPRDCMLDRGAPGAGDDVCVVRPG